jgi:hypothetical protein
MATLSTQEFADFLFSTFSLSKETPEFKTRKTFFAPSEYGDKNYYSVIYDFVINGSKKDLVYFLEKFEDVSLIDFHLDCSLIGSPIKEVSFDFVAKKQIVKGKVQYSISSSMFSGEKHKEKEIYFDNKASLETIFDFPIPRELTDFFLFNIDILSSSR